MQDLTVEESKWTATCPKKTCGAALKWKVGSGWTNPYDHLLACVGRKNPVGLEELADAEIEKKNRKSQMLLQFVPAPNQVGTQEEDGTTSLRLVGARDKAMATWIELIIAHNLPLDNVTKPIFKKLVNGSEDEKIMIGRDLVRDTILMLSYIIEGKVSTEMKSTPVGSIIHDGWSRYGAHYVCLIAVYQKEVRKGCEETVMSMLACSEMPEINGEETAIDTDELSFFQRVDGNPTSSFTAQVHKNFICNHVFMKRYGFSEEQFNRWVVAQTADSASTNLKTARLLGVPHICCTNHLLNHEVETMFKETKEDNGMGSTIDAVQATMTKLKGSNKNMSVLRTHTLIKPQLRNQTRWNGAFTMMNTFVALRNYMILSHGDENTDFEMDQSAAFEARATKITKMLEAINAITTELQGSKLTIAACRSYLDVLIEEADSQRNNITSVWCGNKFGVKYIGLTSDKIPPQSRAFQSGVIKIQRGQASELTMEEKLACKRLKVDPVVENEEQEEETFAARLAKVRATATKRSHSQMMSGGQDEYVNCDFVVGSAAEVERQWSIAGNLLIPGRAKMAPRLFEAIMMLKYNERFWKGNESLVAEAMDMVSSTRKTERAKALLSQVE